MSKRRIWWHADDEEMGKPSGVRAHSRHGGLKGLKIVSNQ